MSTTLLLGLASAWLTLMVVVVASDSKSAEIIISEYGGLLCQSVMVVAGCKLLFEAAIFRHLRSKQTTSMKRSAMLMTGELANATMARFACGFLGGVWMPGFLLFGGSLADGSSNEIFLVIVVAALFVACLIGELLERYLFFSAVVAPRMPGGLTA